jgi:hypothetical protein
MRASISLCILAVACSPESGLESHDDAPAALVVTNGENLNGENLNGENLNGENLNGVNLGGAATGGGLGANVAYALFAGATVDGAALASVSLVGTVFKGIAQDGTALIGAAFTGAQFAAVLLDGSSIELRIDGMAQEQPPNDDVWSYLVEFADAQGNWQPLCQDSTGAAVAAIPLAGRWNYARGVPGGGSKINDPGAFTFACKGLGALAKCVLPIGYKPWKTSNGIPLAQFHQACVRLIRADYCGDGTSWTKDGRLVDLYDGIGIQGDTNPWWLFEAEWVQSGASCVSTYRAIDLRNLLGTLPSCILSRVSLSCGSRWHFSSGTLLMNRYQSPYIGLW